MLFPGARALLIAFTVLVCLLPVSASSALDASARKSAEVAEELQHTGCCDASAAAAIGDNFFVVASDEDSVLRVYSRAADGPPVATFNLRPHLNLGRGSAETDIEGAARLGDLVFWITSHARNKDGKVRPNRHRLFATRFEEAGGRVTMRFEGRAYDQLLASLVAAPELSRFNLAAASRLAPNQTDALNIEGLAATAEGHLLICFRNPVPEGRALLVPLINPQGVIRGQPPRFAAPIQVDLGGLGIRDMVFHEGQFVIVAGPAQGGGQQKLFAWSGPGSSALPFKNVKLKRYNPEAIVIYPDKGFSSFQVFSDDSSTRTSGTPCVELADPRMKTFRSLWISLETEP